MEINILQETKHKIEFELLEEDHTFCNALKTTLLNDKDVKVATYRIDHPLKRNPRMLVETTFGEARKALERAAKSLKKDFEKLGTSIKKEVK